MAKKEKNKKEKSNIICENRKARFDYAILDTFEAGMVLTGSEIKSLRQGKANLTNAYADIRNGEAFLLQAHINPYEKGGYANHEPERKRKLLLHKDEIDSLFGKVKEKGQTLVPLKMYFKNGRAKLLLGLGTGKKTHDKRATIKEREVKRDLNRTLKQAKSR